MQWWPEFIYCGGSVDTIHLDDVSWTGLLGEREMVISWSDEGEQKLFF